jgi:hypothetical protein
MNDIKLTLSKDPRKRSPDITSEAQWLMKVGSLNYELNKKPRHASAGCWVYFIRDSKLVARASARFFVWISKDELGVSFTGELTDQDGWRVEIKPPMQIASRPISHSGFQGFRYVRQDERAAFEPSLC